MRTSRVFAALNLDKTLEEALNALSISLGLAGYRSIKSDQMHLTLYFNGTAKEEDIQFIMDAMDVLDGTREFPVSFTSLLALPNMRQSRLVAAEPGTGRAECSEVYKKLTDRIKMLLPVDARPFLPHVSLLRRNSGKPQAVMLPDIKALTGRVIACTLYESSLYSSGPVYRILKASLFKSVAF